MKRACKLILFFIFMIGIQSFSFYDPDKEANRVVTSVVQKAQILDDDNASLALLRLDGRVYFFQNMYGLQPIDLQIPTEFSMPYFASRILTDSHFIYFLQTSPFSEGLTLINKAGDRRFISSPLPNSILYAAFPSPLGDRLFWIYDASPVPISLSAPCDENPDCPGYVFEVISSDLSGSDTQPIIQIETGVKEYGLQVFFDGWNLQRDAFRINVSFSQPSALYLPEQGLVYEINPLSKEIITHGDPFQGLLLSPDGLWSANAYWGDQSIFEIRQKITNEIRRPELIFGESTLVDQLSFSPSGSSLAWIALSWDSSQSLLKKIALQVMGMESGEICSLLLPLPEKDQYGRLNLPYLPKWINEKFLVVNSENGSRIFNIQSMDWEIEWDTVLHGEDDFLALGSLTEMVDFS